MPDASFGHDHIQRLIRHLNGYGLDLLRGKGKADGDGVMPSAQTLKRAVIKTPAIAQPIARGVKGQKRHDILTWVLMPEFDA